jgi:hypothetical protein
MRGAPSPLWGGLGRGRLHARQPKLRFSVQDLATGLSAMLTAITTGTCNNPPRNESPEPAPHPATAPKTPSPSPPRRRTNR